MYFNQNNNDAALDSYLKALELDPEDSIAMINIGNVYSRMGKHNQAIEAYNNVLRIDPYCVEAEEYLQIALKAAN